MKSLINVIGLIVVSFLCSFKKENPITFNTTTVKAPFGTVSVKAPNFSKSPKLSILDFGAEKGNQEKTTLAISKAITQANKLGGGMLS